MAESTPTPAVREYATVAEALAEIGYEFIPEELWGRDHHSTLMYVETRAVDYSGRLDDRHMRSGPDTVTKYPTRLKDGSTIAGHDDYDCLRDAEALGLLVLQDRHVKLTDAGWAYVGGLRRAKAEAQSSQP